MTDVFVIVLRNFQKKKLWLLKNNQKIYYKTYQIIFLVLKIINLTVLIIKKGFCFVKDDLIFMALDSEF